LTAALTVALSPSFSFGLSGVSVTSSFSSSTMIATVPSPLFPGASATAALIVKVPAFFGVNVTLSPVP
jgi:hypothetical protein